MRPSWVALVATLLACVLGIGSPTRSASVPYFAIIDVPGAKHTGADGIAGGQIVGWFRRAEGDPTHGFVRSPAGHFITFDVPGADGTYAHGITSAGDIVGSWAHPKEQPPGSLRPEHGFFRTASGTFSMFDAPGATSTVPHGIDNTGQIVGTFKDADHKEHGFVATRRSSFRR